MFSAKHLFPGCDLLFLVLDSLRYDAAVIALERGLTPCIQSLLPGGQWEKRHTPGNFTYPAHLAFFAGFLPTPTAPGPHERLFAAAFEGSETTGDSTFVFGEPNLVQALAARNYRTICIGGVGFFNPRTELGKTLGRDFHEHYWEQRFGVTEPDSAKNQVHFAVERLRQISPEQRVFLFVNFSAIHQPNRFYLPGTECDSVETQVAALAYIDGQLPLLIEEMQHRNPTLLILCSDHGTAYGEEGYHGHRLSHPVVWDVPYAEILIPPQKFTSENFDTFTLLTPKIVNSRQEDQRPSGAGCSGGAEAPVANPGSGEPGDFVSYSYSYPHKTAYREIQGKRTLRELWSGENRDHLSLYFHIPFCENRCFYCNLFSIARPETQLIANYVQTLRRQAEIYRNEISDFSFARFAIGGGTPSLLNDQHIESLFETATDVLGVKLESTPISFEVSPETLTANKVAVLNRCHVDRVSVGIQTFNEEERKRLGRPFAMDSLRKSLELLMNGNFPSVNFDLIYGIKGQTEQSWVATVQEAVRWNPAEIYLYPLYVRCGTTLGKAGFHWPDHRAVFYRVARDILCDAGYEQLSMRHFLKRNDSTEGRCITDTEYREFLSRRLATIGSGLFRRSGSSYCQPRLWDFSEFRCQEDGMFGFGCGARSYTRDYHYSFEYSVDRDKSSDAIKRYTRLSDDDFRHAHFGYYLNPEDQKRRYLILSLLRCEGISRGDYLSRFGCDPYFEFAELFELQNRGLLIVEPERLRLNETGIALSDRIGPWLYSHKVRQWMNGMERKRT